MKHRPLGRMATVYGYIAVTLLLINIDTSIGQTTMSFRDRLLSKDGLQTFRERLVATNRRSRTRAPTRGRNRAAVTRQSKAIDYEDDQQDHCGPGQMADVVKSVDGFLQLECHDSSCEDWKKQPAVCDGIWRFRCPQKHLVSGIRRFFSGRSKTVHYKVRCCSHPWFLTDDYAGELMEDLNPETSVNKLARNQGGSEMNFLSNIVATSRWDHQKVIFSRMLCEQTTTTSTTTTTRRTRPTTDRRTTTAAITTEEERRTTRPTTREPTRQTTRPPTTRTPRTTRPKSKEVDTTKKSSHEAKPPKGSSKEKHVGKTSEEIHVEKTSNEELENTEEFNENAGGDKPIAVPPGGCYATGSQVITRDRGVQPVENVTVGEMVLTNANEQHSYQPVIGYLHYERNTIANFVSITTERGDTLTLTDSHMLPLIDCDASISLASADQIWDFLSDESQFASRANVGDCVLTIAADGQMGKSSIVNIITSTQTGVFSPITADGFLVVDGVQTSCYSTIENHFLQHMFFSLFYGLANALMALVKSLVGIYDAMIGWKHDHACTVSQLDTVQRRHELPPLVQFLLNISDQLVVPWL